MTRNPGVAFVLSIVLAILIALLLAVALAAATPAAPLLPNELGRVMILEYHKIDYPEERWTRTPENFRRDLVSSAIRAIDHNCEIRERQIITSFVREVANIF